MANSLYRKYRPTSFDQLIGQNNIVAALTNQIANNSVTHAYLFNGSRGTGKTTTAKIFAKAINCENPQNGSPCNKCSTCIALNNANNMDIVEIDAASNNRVDEIRDLREKVKFSPVYGKYKVYIIDEVHMLTEAAFNALLKTLEEPPAHIVFILATTEVHKIPATILSRCMRFDFNLINEETLAQYLAEIFKKEGVSCDEDSLKLIAKSAEGSVRDMLSIADCTQAMCNKNITYDATISTLGTSDIETYASLIECVSKGNAEKMFQIVHEQSQKSKNLTVFAKELTQTARNMLVCKTCKDANKILNFPNRWIEILQNCCKDIEEQTLMNYLKVFSSIEAEMKYALSPKTLIETALIIALTECNQKKN